MQIAPAGILGSCLNFSRVKCRLHGAYDRTLVAVWDFVFLVREIALVFWKRTPGKNRSLRLFEKLRAWRRPRQARARKRMSKGAAQGYAAASEGTEGQGPFSPQSTKNCYHSPPRALVASTCHCYLDCPAICPESVSKSLCWPAAGIGPPRSSPKVGLNPSSSSLFLAISPELAFDEHCLSGL